MMAAERERTRKVYLVAVRICGTCERRAYCSRRVKVTKGKGGKRTLDNFKKMNEKDRKRKDVNILSKWVDGRIFEGVNVRMCEQHTPLSL